MREAARAARATLKKLNIKSQLEEEMRYLLDLLA